MLQTGTVRVAIARSRNAPRVLTRWEIMRSPKGDKWTPVETWNTWYECNGMLSISPFVALFIPPTFRQKSRHRRIYRLLGGAWYERRWKNEICQFLCFSIPDANLVGVLLITPFAAPLCLHMCRIPVVNFSQICTVHNMNARGKMHY